MKSIISVLFLFVVIAFAGFTVNAQRCKVTDPTGTPLNVRSAPNGRITGKARNGLVVYIERDATDDNGKAWVKIGTYQRNRYVILGWVYREFISCY